MEGQGLDLGDVGFSLTAGTEGLDRALVTLRRFGEEVNKWEKKTDEASQKVTAAYMRQEKSMVSMYQKMQTLSAQGARIGMPVEEINKATNALQQHINTLSLVDKFGNPIARNALEMQRATASASGEIGKFQNNLKNWQAETKKTEQGLRQLAEAEKLVSKGWGTQLQSSMFPQSGLSAKESASTFMNAGMMTDTALANANAHVLAYQKEQAAIRKLTDEYNANANAHVTIYQKEQAAMRQRIELANKGVDAHVQAYRREQVAQEKYAASLEAATQNAVARAQLRANQLLGAGRRAFAPDDMLAGYNTALQQFQAKAAAGMTSAQELKVAQNTLATAFNKTTQEIKDYTAAQTAASRVEKMASSATIRVGRVNDMAQRYQLPSVYGKTNTANLQAYHQALFSGDNNATQTAFNNLNKGLKDTQEKIANASAGAQKFSSSLRGVERATILAMGPLSGVGARVAVLAALFESTSAKTALFIAGLTGVGATVGLTAAAAIKARIAWEQWNSMLIAASGSIALAGDEMDYVSKVADKYGFAIQGLVPSYANFATSTRLAGVALKDQRAIFESFTTAGAALHWTTEQSGRAFLALEQMMSKGTVQTQELKLQMGQVLPGAFELAAKAAGKTQAEFAKMMQQGQVISKDFVPVFAAKVKEVYDAAAKYGAQSIQADINRFATQRFDVAKAFDDAIRASTIFHKLLQDINATMSWMQQNAGKTVAVFVSGIAVLATAYIPALIMGLGKVVVHLREMTILGSLLTSFTPIGLLKTVATIGLMAGTGYLTYKTLASAMTVANDKTQELIDKNAMALGQYEVLGEISKREKEAHIQALQKGIEEAQNRIKSINEETKATIALANATLSVAEALQITQKARSDMLGKDTKKMGFFEEWGRSIGAAANPGTTPGQLQKAAQEAKVYADENTPEAITARKIAAAKKQLTDLQKQMEGFQKLKLTPEDAADTTAADKLKAKYESTYNSVAKMFTDLKMVTGKQDFINAQIKIAPITQEEMNKAFDRKEAEKTVADFFEKMKDKTKATFVAMLSKDFKSLFDANGIKGNNLEEKLVNLQVKLKADQRALQESEKNAIAYGIALAELSVRMQEYTDASIALDRATALNNASMNGTEAERTMKERFDNIDKMRSERAKIMDAVLATDSSDFLAFSKRIDGAEAKLQAYQNSLDAVANRNKVFGEYSQVDSTISNTQTSLQAQVAAGLISQQQAAVKLRRATGEAASTLGNDFIPRLQALQKITTDPSEIAALQAKIDKYKEWVNIGKQTTASEGIKAALKEYANTTVDAFQTAHDAITNMLKGVENSIVDLVMTGKTDFSSLAKSIISDLIRIQIQQNLLKPIASALGGSTGGSSGNGMGSAIMSTIAQLIFSAQGNTFSANTGLSAYSNSIVNTPTVFKFAKGVGMMGEKVGSPGEAIMPLTRDSKGDLAVSAVGIQSRYSSDMSEGITFNINVSSTGGTQENSNGQVKDSNLSKLADLIKSTVVNVITTEKRPGGLLA